MLAVIGIVDSGANVTFGAAVSIGMLSITSVLSSLYPVVTAILAAVFLRERLRAVQYVGVAVVMLGVLMISALGT